MQLTDTETRVLSFLLARAEQAVENAQILAGDVGAHDELCEQFDQAAEDELPNVRAILFGSDEQRQEILRGW